MKFEDLLSKAVGVCSLVRVPEEITPFSDYNCYVVLKDGDQATTWVLADLVVGNWDDFVKDMELG